MILRTLEGTVLLASSKSSTARFKTRSLLLNQKKLTNQGEDSQSEDDAQPEEDDQPEEVDQSEGENNSMVQKLEALESKVAELAAALAKKNNDSS